MVLSILSETTSPTRSLRWPRCRFVSGIFNSGGLSAQFGNTGFNSRDIAAQHPEPRRFFQLGTGLLEPQVKQFLAQVAPLGRQLDQCQILQFGRVHSFKRRDQPSLWREMNLVLIGSLAEARRMDSRATASVTPSTSNSTLAGRITATQDSTPPLPVPMRTSRGFLVTDLSGNTRSQTLPRRFM